MQRHRKNPAFTGKGAAVIMAVALFAISLLGFTIWKHDIPLPVLNPSGDGGTAQGPGQWASNLISIELPVFSDKVNKLTASSSDPDWPLQTEPTQPASGTEVTPIVTTGNGPVIMLYSTHSNESFLKTDETVYKEIGNSNTLNKNYNILKVNSTLSKLLLDTYHLPIYFDSTDHELGKYYTTSYERSLATINKAKKTYPTLSVFFDIHRDSAGSAVKNDYVTIDGKKCAKVMFVVGTGEGKTGTGFKERPNWKKNKALAELITEELNKIAPGLGKPVRVNTGRYNQHVSDAALAIEVGHNKNTLEEALNATPYLAQAIYNVLTKDLDIKTVSVP